jgi:hypothetical protein
MRRCFRAWAQMWTPKTTDEVLRTAEVPDAKDALAGARDILTERWQRTQGSSAGCAPSCSARRSSLLGS